MIKIEYCREDILHTASVFCNIMAALAKSEQRKMHNTTRVHAPMFKGTVSRDMWRGQKEIVSIIWLDNFLKLISCGNFLFFSALLLLPLRYATPAPTSDVQ